MQNEQAIKWEYRVIWMEMRQVMITDVEQNVANLDQQLNSLGAQGWELVFVQDVGGGKVGTRFAYILKRRVLLTTDSQDATQTKVMREQATPSRKLDWKPRW